MKKLLYILFLTVFSLLVNAQPFRIYNVVGKIVHERFNPHNSYYELSPGLYVVEINCSHIEKVLIIK